MAGRVRPAEEGETCFGSARAGIRGSLRIQANAGANKPAMLFLDSVSDLGVVTTYALWVDSTGDLRIIAANDTAIDSVVTDQDSDGTIVGTQS